MKLMKILLPVFLLLTVVTNLQAQDIAGRYFGKVKYDDRSREVALLLNSIDSEPGSYYGVVYEYLNAYELDFILKFVKPGEKNGYLQELLQWVQIYKFVEDCDSNGSVYKMHRLSVVNGEIKVNPKAEASKLTLSDNESVDAEENRLEGAKLSLKINNKDVVVNFKSQKILGRTVDDITKRFPLESTWENKYTPGPYNPGYKQADITVLDLLFDKSTKAKTAKFNVEKLNGKNLEIKGDFSVKQVDEGMFTFVATNLANTKGANLVQDKIAVFVDIFDFKPRMATVELILIDPANDNNSQMYFEEYGNPDVQQLKK